MNQYLLNAFSIIIQKIKWYDYTSQRQNNIDEEEKNGNSIKKLFPLSKKQLFSDSEIFERKNRKNKIKIIGDSLKTSYLLKAVIKNIAKFLKKILGKKFNINNLFKFDRINFPDNYYYVEEDPFFLSKLMEIYETGDIELLTFYEFI